MPGGGARDKDGEEFWAVSYFSLFLGGGRTWRGAGTDIACSPPPFRLSPWAVSISIELLGLTCLKLSDKRRVSINTWRGHRQVAFREYYEKDGELLPTKKVRCLGCVCC